MKQLNKDQDICDVGNGSKSPFQFQNGVSYYNSHYNKQYRKNERRSPNSNSGPNSLKNNDGYNVNKVSKSPTNSYHTQQKTNSQKLIQQKIQQQQLQQQNIQQQIQLLQRPPGSKCINIPSPPIQKQNDNPVHRYSPGNNNPNNNNFHQRFSPNNMSTVNSIENNSMVHPKSPKFTFNSKSSTSESCSGGSTSEISRSPCYAGAKFGDTPAPRSLPLPPAHWLKCRQDPSILKPCNDLAMQLKVMLQMA